MPDPVANEMAAELEADLQEAEAEGASAEEVLGTGAFDPRSFASAWAAERGVIQRPPTRRNGVQRRFLTTAGIGAFALIAIIGAVLVILDSPSGQGTLALEPRAGQPLRAIPRTVRIITTPLPPPDAGIIAAPDARMVVDIHDSDVDTRSLGSILLIAGLAGVVPLALFSSWVAPGVRPRNTGS